MANLNFETQDQGWLSQTVLQVDCGLGLQTLAGATSLLNQFGHRFKAQLYHNGGTEWLLVLQQHDGDVLEKHFFLSRDQGQTWLYSERGLSGRELKAEADWG